MQDWYYAKNGQQVGPVAIDHLRELARNGQVGATDLVWNPSMKDWTPAGQLAEIFTTTQPDADAPAPDTSNPYAAPQSPWTAPDATPGLRLAEITPGSEPIDVGACVKRGFELTTRNFANILLIGVVYIGISIAASILLGALDSALGIGQTRQTFDSGGDGAMSIFTQTSSASPLNAIVSNLLSIFLTLGLIRIGLNLVSGQPVSVSQLFSGGRHMLRAIGASILYGAMLVVGFILLIVPGIYLALRFGQYMNAIVDRNMGIMESLSYSSSITTNNRLNLFLLALMAIAIALAGCLALVVGLIFAYPVIGLSWMVAYRWMQYGHRAAMDQPGTQTPMLTGV
jgi:uncharacterized membrane protein